MHVTGFDYGLDQLMIPHHHHFTVIRGKGGGLLFFGLYT